jgi:hypothetical protein
MLDLTDKANIFKYLGKQPSRLIRPHLKKNKFFNTKGEEFSPKSIQNIFNGITANFDVELEILQLVEMQKIKLKKQQEQLQIIKSKI